MFLNRLSSNGIKESHFWDSFSIQLPNCTTYVIGEYLEQGGAKKQLFKGRGVLGFPNAKSFYSDWLFAKGTVPKVGGFIVWGSTNAQYGHVAFCYDVQNLPSGWRIKVSQSNYGGTYFETKVYDVEVGKVTKGVGYPYIGCCYNEFDDKRVARDEYHDQIEIICDKLTARKSPEGESYVGLYLPRGIYNVEETFQGENYKWFRVDNVWFASNEDVWTKFYKGKVKEDPEILMEEFDQLSAQISFLQDEREKLTKQLKETQNLLTEAQNDLKTKNAIIYGVKEYINLMGDLVK